MSEVYVAYMQTSHPSFSDEDICTLATCTSEATLKLYLPVAKFLIYSYIIAKECPSEVHVHVGCMQTSPISFSNEGRIYIVHVGDVRTQAISEATCTLKQHVYWLKFYSYLVSVLVSSRRTIEA